MTSITRQVPKFLSQLLPAEIGEGNTADCCRQVASAHDRDPLGLPDRLQSRDAAELPNRGRISRRLDECSTFLCQ
jgi:hypothetical protein